jgi:hypothetical protein
MTASAPPMHVVRSWVRGLLNEKQALASALRRRSGAPPAGLPTVVVSLTTHPSRASGARHAIRSLQHQSIRPDLLVVALARDEWGADALPEHLAEQVERGRIVVLWRQDTLRQYMKLLPALAEWNDGIIVTADDDVVYPRRWLEQLLDAHLLRPGAVIGHRGFRITFEEGGLAPYESWPVADPRVASAITFLTGVGGCLYPPGVLPPETLDHTLARRLCASNDDVWLKAMTLLGRVPTIALGHDRLKTTRVAEVADLKSVNLVNDANLQQMGAVLDHFGLWPQLRASQSE